MCASYYIDDDTLQGIEQIVRELDNNIRGKKYSTDIHPTDSAPIIVNNKSSLMLTEQKWGYPGINNKGIIFNSRSETVLQKKIFNNGIYNNRAIIPVKHFYEWNKNKEKHVFSDLSNKPLYLAGFYDEFNGEKRFVILTTAANESMAGVHDRMPLILENDQVEDWIFDNSYTEKILTQVPMMLNKSAEYVQQTLFGFMN